MAGFSSYKILIGSFEFNRKPVEILQTACYVIIPAINYNTLR